MKVEPSERREGQRPSQSGNQPQPAPRDMEQAAAVSRAVSETEFVEPLRITDAGVVKPTELLGFVNPTGHYVDLSVPERVRMLPGTASKFPAGYHRAIHRQSPHLVCEHGEKCPTGLGTRGDKTYEEYVEAMKPVKMTGAPR